MRSYRLAAHTGFVSTLPRRLRRSLRLLIVVGLLAASTAAAQTQQSSTDLSPSNEARKGGGGASTTPRSSAPGAALDLATLDVAEFLRACDRNGAQVHRQLLNYTYRLRKIRRELNDQGKAVVEQAQEFEAYPVRGQHILIQLTQNGLPLSDAEVAWQRRRAGEKLERAEHEAEQQKQSDRAAEDEAEGYPAAGVYGRVQRRIIAITIDPATVLRAGDLTAPRLEPLGDRQTVVFDFRLRPGAELPPRRDYLARLTGRVWIDVADKVIARIEAWPTDESRKSDPPQAAVAEPRLIYQQTKLATGAWVPTLMRINSGGNPALFNGLNWDVAFEFTDYKQFKTSVEELKVEPKPDGSN